MEGGEQRSMLLFVGVIFCRYFVWMLAGGHRREQELELSFECEYYGSALVNQRWSDNSHVAVCWSRLVLSSIISSISLASEATISEE